MENNIVDKRVKNNYWFVNIYVKAKNYYQLIQGKTRKRWQECYRNHLEDEKNKKIN